MVKYYAQIILALAALSLAGCGGGSGAGATLPTNTAVVFSVTPAVAGFNSAIEGIQVTATLPTGVFPNISSGRFLRIGETGLKSLKGNGSIAFGRYSATTNQVVFAMVANPINSDLGTGDFARLTYTATGSTSPTAADFQQFSCLVSGAGGTDLSAQVTKGVSLTTYLKP
jgi:hypothetical protein